MRLPHARVPQDRERPLDARGARGQGVLGGCLRPPEPRWRWTRSSWSPIQCASTCVETCAGPQSDLCPRDVFKIKALTLQKTCCELAFIDRAARTSGRAARASGLRPGPPRCPPIKAFFQYLSAVLLSRPRTSAAALSPVLRGRDARRRRRNLSSRRATYPSDAATGRLATLLNEMDTKSRLSWSQKRTLKSIPSPFVSFTF